LTGFFAATFFAAGFFAAGLDAGFVAGLVAGLDAGFVAGLDAGLVAGLDAGLDAGLVAGLDAGLDAGFDDGTGVVLSALRIAERSAGVMDLFILSQVARHFLLCRRNKADRSDEYDWQIWRPTSA
jgi:hypothetical protein